MKTSDLSHVKLIAMGYRRTSLAFGYLSRIDYPDWKQKIPPNMKRGLQGKGDVEDFYRRCHSRDKVQVPVAVAKLVPSSSWDATGYIKLQASKQPE